MLRAYREDGTEVKEGDLILDFREESWVFLNVLPGTSLDRGKIYAKKQTGSKSHRILFPSVFKLKIQDDVDPESQIQTERR